MTTSLRRAAPDANANVRTKMAKSNAQPLGKRPSAAKGEPAVVSGWQTKPKDPTVKKFVATATKAVGDMVENYYKNLPNAPDTSPLIEKFGEKVGKALAVIGTAALAALPKANAPLKDAKGDNVASAPGVKQIGTASIRVRHQALIGPKILDYAQKMKPGVLHDLVEGLGRGVVKGPGAEYRIEAGVRNRLNR